jgi:hypothetical protein
MGCTVVVVFTVEVIPRDDEEGFRGEMCLANEEGIYVAVLEEELYFVFMLIEPLLIPLRNP